MQIKKMSSTERDPKEQNMLPRQTAPAARVVTDCTIMGGMWLTLRSSAVDTNRPSAANHN